MKVNRTILFLIAILINGSCLFAQKQQDEPAAFIRVIAKYYPNDNQVKLRILPDKKSVLKNGVNNGFIIERANINKKITRKEDLVFTKIGETKVFSKNQWQQVLNSNNNKLKQRYEAAKVFYDGINDTPTKNQNNFQDIIKQKKEGQFKFVMLVLSAIQKDEIAKALGLSFDDNNVQANSKYVYRVKLKNYHGPYKVTEVPYLITTTKDVHKLQKINVTVGDKKLGFDWKENQMLSGVIVERKNKQTGKYEPLNQTPKYSLSVTTLKNGFEDSNLINNQTYEYRFYGFDAFGEKILFGEVKATPKDVTPPKRPVDVKAKHHKPEEILISWKIPEPVDNDLKGFNVLYSKNVKSDFTKINKKLLSKDKRSFIHKNFNKDLQNYYIIEAIDNSGNTNKSFSAYATIIDTIPPAIPKFEAVKMDSTGVVTVKIIPNTEKDLKGYRLFMANNLDHEFSAIQENFVEDNKTKPNTVFKDTVTLNTLTPYVYYKVKALDFHHNQSEFSKPFKLKRIDTISPSNPVIKSVKVTKEAIRLELALSNSSDVKEHYLYRKTKSNADWKQIAVIKNNTVFNDSNVTENTRYYYSLRAVDQSGLFSDFAFPVTAKAYKNIILPEIKSLKSKEVKNTVILSWKYPKQDNDVYFVVYKTNSNGDLAQYKRTDKTEFTDKNPLKNSKYAVKAFSKKGKYSKLSKIVGI